MPTKILIVDDSITARRQVINAIADLGHVIIEGINGQDGLTKFQADPGISIVISDLNMPIMNGLEMAAAIRQSSQNSQVPIILATTECTEEQVERGRQANVIAWLVKPFNPNHLRAALKDALALKA